jgi:hypothetical protein
MKIIQIIKRLFDDPADPVRHCDVYKAEGCAHVDGFLCDMKTCGILADYRAAKLWGGMKEVLQAAQDAAPHPEG